MGVSDLIGLQFRRIFLVYLTATVITQYLAGLVSPTGAPLRGPQAGFVSGTPGGRLATWIIGMVETKL